MTAATIFEVCTSIFPLLASTLTLVALPHPASTTSRNNVLVVILPSPSPRPPQPPPTSLRHSLVGLPRLGPPCSNHQQVVMTRWWFFSPAPVLAHPNRHQRVVMTRWWLALPNPGPRPPQPPPTSHNDSLVVCSPQPCPSLFTTTTNES